MEWLWAAFGLVWTWWIGAFALYCWRAPARWKEGGTFSNGLGWNITRAGSPKLFAVLTTQYRFFGCFGFLMALFGAGVTLGWLWKSLGR